MISNRSRGILLAAVAFTLVCSTVFAAPVYQSVLTSRTNYDTGSVVVSASPADQGSAKVEWHNWYDSSTQLYYYAYKIYNNEAGTAGNRLDDYHFGHVYDSGSYLPINIFSLDWIDQVMQFSDIVVVGSAANATSTGTPSGSPWLGSVDYNVMTQVSSGMHWTVTGASGAQPIAPTQWDYVKHGSSWTWDLISSGNMSTGDSGSYRYFELASTLAPGSVTASISNSSYNASGIVEGPVVMVPEPASCLILGLGSLALISRRRTVR